MNEFRYCPLCGKSLTKSTMDGKEVLCCASSDCGYVFWDNPIPVVAAIVEMDGRIVLARNKEWPGKIFGLVTGFLEKGETPETAVKREVKEELGIDSEMRELVGVYSFFERNQLIIAYHLSATGEIKLGDELAEVKSIPIDKLKPWPFGTGHAVRDWLERRSALR
ncbi:MAG TPA: NUDIX hydrolase [Thermodesulfobacteriota bacterium]|nr:NUDIX hydrolase [Thermodesulfobacteriota bacterium]